MRPKKCFLLYTPHVSVKNMEHIQNTVCWPQATLQKSPAQSLCCLLVTVSTYNNEQGEQTEV